MTDTLDIEQARRRSVTQGDVEEARSGSMPLTILMGPLGLLSEIPGLQAHGQLGLPSPGSKARDVLLSLAPTFEPSWAGAQFKAISKQAALGFRLEDATDSERRIKFGQKLLIGYDGSYVAGVQRGLQDFLNTNTGMVVEIARVSNARGSRVAGLFHLDALRCFRTADPARPILYQNWRGEYHLLDEENIIAISDLPSPRVEMRGMGQCAADRAWATIIKLAGVEIYFREKITGARNLAIHIIRGLSWDKLNSALSTSEEAHAERGFILYKGSTIIPYQQDNELQLITIPLAEVPDGFSVEEERKDARKVYAWNIGLNPDELVERPAGLNSGLSAQVADESAEGQGLAAWRKAWELAITHKVLPGSTTFYLATNDMRDKKLKADWQKSAIDAAGALVERQILSGPQALNWLVDQGVLEKALLPQDVTPAGVVTDNEKVPTGGDAPVQAQALLAQAQPPVPQERMV
jgi:hypothetical protein